MIVDCSNTAGFPLSLDLRTLEVIADGRAAV